MTSDGVKLNNVSHTLDRIAYIPDVNGSRIELGFQALRFGQLLQMGATPHEVAETLRRFADQIEGETYGTQ